MKIGLVSIWKDKWHDIIKVIMLLLGHCWDSLACSKDGIQFPLWTGY